MENRTAFNFFLFNNPIIEKIVSDKYLRQVWDKRDVKVAYEKTYRLKFEFYNTDIRKVENIIMRNFTSIIMHPTFKHFR